jgi:hypothetical protein
MHKKTFRDIAFLLYVFPRKFHVLYRGAGGYVAWMANCAALTAATPRVISIGTRFGGTFQRGFFLFMGKSFPFLVPLVQWLSVLCFLPFHVFFVPFSPVKLCVVLVENFVVVHGRAHVPRWPWPYSLDVGQRFVSSKIRIHVRWQRYNFTSRRVGW